MAQILVNIGTSENSGDGDAINVAGSKINSNFTELYARPSVASHIGMVQNNISSTLTNADITLQASGTGSIVFPGIKINDNNIEGTRSNEDIKLVPSGSGSVVFAGVAFNGSSISATDSSSININENLIVDGSLNASGNAVLTGAVTMGSTLTATAGLSTLSQLSVSGTTTLGTTNIDNISIDDNIISTSSNADLFITPGGGGVVNMTNLTVDSSINFTDNEISLTTSNADLELSASGTGDIVIAGIRIHGTSFTSDTSSTINFNEALIIDGAVTIQGAVTLDSTLAVNNNVTVTGDLTVSANSTLPAPIQIDNLNINDNIISSDSNADIILTPGGTGAVNISQLIVDGSITMTDNQISVGTSNADLILSGASSGSVAITKGAITGSVENTVVGDTTPADGTFTTLTFDPAGGGTLTCDGVTITDNQITSNASNASLNISSSGTGNVVINGFALPSADGDTGQVIVTNGSGVLSFITSAILLGFSDIQDAQNTIGFSSITDINPNTSAGDHESITASSSVIDEFDKTKYDSAFYHIITRTEAHDSSIEFAVQKMIIAQGTEDGSTFGSFGGASQIVNTTTSPVLDQTVQLTTDIRSSKVRLVGQGGSSKDGSTTNAINAVKYYRIGLGDNDSSVSDGKTTTIVVADLDSATANLDTFAKADYRGAKYYISINNTTSNEVQSTEVLVIHNGTDAFIQEYNTIISNTTSDPLATFTADISGSNVRLRGANGTAGTCRVTMYRVLLADNESDSSGTHVSVLGAQTVTNTSQTTVNTDTFRGTASPDVSSQKVISDYANTFDSVWFHAINKDITNNELMLQKYSTLHGTTSDGSTQTALLTDSSIVKTGAFNDVNTVDVGISGSKIQLLATGQSDGSTTIVNATTYFAIGLGDNTADATSGNIGTENGITIGGGGSASVDSWAHASYRGAKYYISAKNNAGETQNVEALVVHDGTGAYISTYNDIFTNASFVTLTAAISGSNVVVTATGAADVVVKFYRIRLADGESSSTGTDFNTIGAVTVSSSATAIDTFEDVNQTGAHYIIVGFNNGESSASIMEANVITNGVDAFVSGGPKVSTKESDQLILTAAHNGSATVTLSAASTSGSSTTVNAFRIHMLRGDAQTYTVLDSFAHSTYQGAFYVAVGKNADNESQIADLAIASDGDESYILNTGPNISTHSTSSPVVTFTTGINGGNVELRGQNTQENTNTIVNMYRIHLARAAGNPSSVATLDTFSATDFRSAKYTVSISDTASGDAGLFETCDVNVTHDGSTVYLSVFGRVTNHTADLVTFSADIDSGNVRLRGTISNTNSHTVTVIRRVVRV